MTTEPPHPGQPLMMMTDPQLDRAIQAGWDEWEVAARRAGPERVAKWLAVRLHLPDLVPDLREHVGEALAEADEEERTLALAELAELAEAGDDDLIIDTLWEGVLRLGRATNDADAIAEATSRLAAIAERLDDPLAAAEYYIDFLNWRRQPGHSSDPEQVETAFDEVIRLAEADREPAAAALFAHRQAEFARLQEQEDERASEGEWETSPAPYTGWA